MGGVETTGTETAAARWTAVMAARQVPEEVLAHAPASPYRQDPERFRPAAEPPDTPSRRAALALLGEIPDAGDRTVLDVGCGAGAASLALAGEIAHVVGVDPASDMLAAFVGACLDRGGPHQAGLGRWAAAAGAPRPARPRPRRPGPADRRRRARRARRARDRPAGGTLDHGPAPGRGPGGARGAGRPPTLPAARARARRHRGAGRRPAHRTAARARH